MVWSDARHLFASELCSFKFFFFRFLFSASLMQRSLNQIFFVQFFSHLRLGLIAWQFPDCSEVSVQALLPALAASVFFKVASPGV